MSDEYPDRWKHKYQPGDYVVARCTHHFGEGVSIVEGNIYRVKTYRPYDINGTRSNHFDGVVLEEFPKRQLAMLASRFLPANVNQMPDNRAYYKAVTENVS